MGSNVMIDLVKGSHYSTLSYGMVEFMGEVPDQNMANNVCYKFKTERGRIKYLRPGELESFLRKEE